MSLDYGSSLYSTDQSSHVDDCAQENSSSRYHFADAGFRPTRFCLAWIRYQERFFYGSLPTASWSAIQVHLLMWLPSGSHEKSFLLRIEIAINYNKGKKNSMKEENYIVFSLSQYFQEESFSGYVLTFWLVVTHCNWNLRVVEFILCFFVNCFNYFPHLVALLRLNL